MSSTLLKCPFHSSKPTITEMDMLDPETRSNPFPFYDWLRQDEERRIYKLPQEKTFYVVHKHEDVKNVLANHKDFANNILPTKKSPFFALMDGPSHMRIRTIAAQMLSIKKASFPLDNIKKNIAHFTETTLEKKSVELFTEWADPIPLSTLCVIFGLPYDQESIEKLHTQAIAINRALFALGGTGPRRSSKPNVKEKYHISMAVLKNTGNLLQLKKSIGLSGMGEVMDMFIPKKSNKEYPRPNFQDLPDALSPLIDLMLMFSKIIEDKTHKSDAIEILRNSILKNEISKTEAIMVCAFVMFAGYETTTSLLSNCVAHLAQNQTTFDHLKSNPDSIEAFIDEAIRIYTPVGRFIRRTTKEVSIGGTTMPKDALIIVMLGAANTDPDVFNDPFTFDSKRDNPQRHLSFGKGIHFCLGAPLAKFQIKTSLQELISNTSSIQLDEAKTPKMVTDRDNGILRYEELNVSFNS